MAFKDSHLLSVSSYSSIQSFCSYELPKMDFFLPFRQILTFTNQPRSNQCRILKHINRSLHKNHRHKHPHNPPEVNPKQEVPQKVATETIPHHKRHKKILKQNES